MNAPVDNSRRELVRPQILTLALLLLNAFALGVTLTAWAVVTYQIHSQPIIP